MYKKLISSIIAISLMLSLFTSLPVSAANLLVNSGFELGANSWTVAAGSAAVTGREKAAGRASMRCFGRTEDYATPQQFLKLENGKTYTLSCWVKMASGSDDITFFVEPYRADGSKFPVNICTVPINTEWTHIQHTFTLNTESFTKIKILAKVTSLVDLYFDEFEVWEGTSAGSAAATPAATVKPKASAAPQLPTNPEDENTSSTDKTKINLISNSDFEKGITGYTAKNAELSQADGVVSGNSSMQVKPADNTGAVITYADMRDRKNYELNMWYKGGDIKVYTDGGVVIAEGSNTNEWKLINESFVYKTATDKPYILIEGSSEFFLDAVSLFEVPLSGESGNTSVTVNSSNIVSNYSFENDKEGWMGTKIEIVTDTVHSGSKAVLSKGRANNYDGPQQVVQLQANTDYYVSAWVRASSGTAKARMRLQATGIVSPGLVTVTTEWTKVSAVLNTGSNTSAKLYVQTDGNPDIYVDDYEVYPYVEGVEEEDAPVSVNPEGITSEGKEKAYLWDFSCNPGTAHILAGWQVQTAGVDSASFYSIKPEAENGLAKLNLQMRNANMTTMKDKSLELDADKYKYISIKAQNNTQSKTFRIGWWSNGNTANNDVITYDLRWPDKEGVQEIIVDLSSCPAWKGTINRLRFYPADSVAIDQYKWALPTENVVLESISVFADEPEHTEAVTEGAITRADFVHMLISKLELMNHYTTSSSFDDAGANAKWYESILAAEETGIVSGNGAGYFNPGGVVSREHAAIMLMRAAGYLDKQTDRTVKEFAFDDASAFSGGMISAASWAVNTGIMQPINGSSFEPQGILTGQEADEIINRLVAWADGAPQNGGVFVSAPTAGTYDIVRLSVSEPNGGAYANPYDYEEVKADAVFTAPDGSTLTVPGYYDMLRDFEYDPRRQVEENTQDSTWKFRFTPTMAGEWSFDIRLTHNGSVKSLGGGKITAVESGRPGFIRRDENNPRFVRDNGEVFHGFGINTFGPTGTDGANYITHERYFKNYAQDNGTNLWRIWFENTTRMLESYVTGIGKFDNAFAQELDYTMLLARQNGVAILPSTKTHHMLVSTQSSAGRSQYFSLNGGPLEVGVEVYSNPETVKAYKQLLRFIIARYSAFDNLLLWEFWNEEEAITGWRTDTESISKWHDEMLAFVSETDPYDHVAGSSGKSPAGEYFLFEKEMTDYVCLHSYNVVQPALITRADAALKRQLYGNKPNIIEELSVRNTLFDADKDGAITHETLWSSIAAGNAGVTPPWWWDTWMENNQHWKIFGPVSKFMEGFSWPDEDIKLVNFTTTSAEKGDFVIPANYYETTQYGETPLGTTPIKTEFKYDFAKNPVREVTDMIFESQIKNDMPGYTFKVNLPEATNFKVALVGAPISANAGRPVSVSVDGGEWVDYKTDVDKYVAEFLIPVGAGEHTIAIKNNGNSNFFLGWVAFEDMAPLVAAEGAVGENSAVIYVRDTETVYSKMCFNGYQPPVIAGATVDLTGLGDGTYDLIWWNTYEGYEVSRQEITVTGGNAPTVEVPAFTKDIAAKIIRKSY